MTHVIFGVYVSCNQWVTSLLQKKTGILKDAGQTNSPGVFQISIL